MSITIRQGRKEDCEKIFALIYELAVYEKGEHNVTNSIEKLREDGFGKTPLYTVYVAEKDNEIVGIALYYWRYSTWKGRRLYLEDIVVTQSARGSGIGKLLFDKMLEVAREHECGMMWQVLDWNEPAIQFYKKYNATFDGEWLNGSLEKEDIERILTKERGA